MDEPVRVISWDPHAVDPEPLIEREWLLTNGLGGYASGTLSGIMTRKHHGILVAALPPPAGRIVMLQNLGVSLRLPDGTIVSLDGEDATSRKPEVPAASALREFRLEMGLPVWRFEVGGIALEKRIVVPHGQNTTYISLRLHATAAVEAELFLRPAIHFRSYDAPVTTPPTDPRRVSVHGDRYEIDAGEGLPPLRLAVHPGGASFTADESRVVEVFYRAEHDRGYESVGEVWSPGVWSLRVTPAAPVTLVASTEPWETAVALDPAAALAAEQERRKRLLELAPPALRQGVGAELLLAADQFIIEPVGRADVAAYVRAQGDHVRTVIAGYHWFTDWGRDTMISLEGLTLTTGRHREAGYILRTFAHYVRDGLIPNMFPDGSNEGLYHTADATLWFFHAMSRYLQATDDRKTLDLILPTLVDIAEHHLRGTRFNIGVDPGDGLLRQGAAGYQLTWMDAKAGDWVVTPRRGKAVEINALWYNALCLLSGWVRAAGDADAAATYAGHAARGREAFNHRFWYAEGGYLYDLVDGEDGRDDAACRPNQLLAITLDHPVLERGRWEPVVETVRGRLLTPVGLRSLAPDHPDYRPRYFGDLRTRDAAYHQGTVWGWLIGPFVDAWLRVHPEDRTGARRLLDGHVAHLGEFGVGTVAEIFDAKAPFTPRGCIAQAWSVAETLRCWERTLEGALNAPFKRA